MEKITRTELTNLAREGAVTRRKRLLEELVRLNKFIGDGASVPALTALDATGNGNGHEEKKKVEKVRAKKVRVMSPETRKRLSEAMKASWRAGKMGKKKKARKAAMADARLS